MSGILIEIGVSEASIASVVPKMSPFAHVYNPLFSTCVVTRISIAGDKLSDVIGESILSTCKIVDPACNEIHHHFHTSPHQGQNSTRKQHVAQKESYNSFWQSQSVV